MGDQSETRNNEYQSGLGSDNFEGASGGNQDAGGDQLQQKNKKCQRYTPQQLWELEALSMETLYPNDKQKLDLSKRIGLEKNHVTYWFQNRRTQLKMQLERCGNTLFRQENEKLQAENYMMKDAMENARCNHCGGPLTVSGQVSLEMNKLIIEHALLQDELSRMYALASAKKLP